MTTLFGMGILSYVLGGFMIWGLLKIRNVFCGTTKSYITGVIILLVVILVANIAIPLATQGLLNVIKDFFANLI